MPLLSLLKTEVADLLNWFHLVKFQKTGSGAEDIRLAFFLVNCLSIQENLFAAGARRRQIHVSDSGRCRCRVSFQWEHWTNLQVLLRKTHQYDNSQKQWSDQETFNLTWWLEIKSKTSKCQLLYLCCSFPHQSQWHQHHLQYYSYYY